MNTGDLFSAPPAAPAPPAVISVSELNRRARLAVERALPVGWVAGEISNFTRAPSGHWYFTLKDAQAAVRCAMFRNRNQFVDWRPENGMQVEVKAQATLYEARGEFQLGVEAMRRAGQGALFEAFVRLKARLEAEGLFDPARKRPLPPQPRAIGVITSPRAAALRDVLTTLARRWPAARVVIYPSLVQGEAAPTQLTAALARAAQRRECDVLLLVRGGGSLEDLWAFNDEGLARAVAASPLPVVSGVGHETDFTIADFAADLRAPTPTGAAQLATPDRRELAQGLLHLNRRLEREMRRRLEARAQRLDHLSRRLTHPAARLQAQRQHLGHLEERLRRGQANQLARLNHNRQRLEARLTARRPHPALLRARVDALAQRLAQSLAHRMQRRRDHVERLASHLAHLNPEAVLGRGYGIVRDSAGHILRDSRQTQPGQAIDITLASGQLAAQVTGRQDAEA